MEHKKVHKRIDTLYYQSSGYDISADTDSKTDTETAWTVKTTETNWFKTIEILNTPQNFQLRRVLYQVQYQYQYQTVNHALDIHIGVKFLAVIVMNMRRPYHKT